MASLALGLVGGYLFGPIGYLVGSALGSLISPPKGPQGPRWNDLKPQTSSYGTMIPIIYGSYRVPGMLVWCTDFQEHSSGGGKGGPSSENFTYTVSCAIKFSKGPITQIRRIWADNQIIYSRVNGEPSGDGLPFTFYLGDNENAQPDPTMQAILGMGNVPAFKDDVVMVATDWDITQYGRLPSVNAELVEIDGPIPFRTASFTPLDFLSQQDGGCTSDGTHITQSTYKTAGGLTTTAYRTQVVDYQGNVISDNTISIPNMDGYNGCDVNGCFNNPSIMLMKKAASGTTDVSAWYFNGVQVARPVFPPTGTDTFSLTNGLSVVFQNDNVFGVCEVNLLTRWPAPGGVPVSTPDIFYTLPTILGGNPNSYQISPDDDGTTLWVSCVASGQRALFQFDNNLNLLDSWTDSQNPPPNYGTPGGSNGIMLVRKTQMCFWQNDVAVGGDAYVVANNNGDGTFTTLPAPYIGQSPSDVLSLGGGFGIVVDGIICINPPPASTTLAAIITDITARCGKSAANIDVTQCPDLVDGYGLTDLGSGRDGLKQLLDAYFKDGVEEDTVVRFIARGGQPLLTVDINDMGAYAYGSTPPALITNTYVQEEDLPAELDVNYINGGAFYQSDTQRGIRQVTRSQDIRAVNLAINMTPQKASQVAKNMVFNGWLERKGWTLNLPIKYVYVSPTDVLTIPPFGDVPTFDIRLTKESLTADGICSFDAVTAFELVWLGTYATSAGQGVPPGPVIPPTSVTALSLLDIPLVTDIDLSPGIYATAMQRLSIFKSTDGGTTFNADSSVPSAFPTGIATTLLGDFFGGNVFDELTIVTIVLASGTGSLESINELGVLNGGNMALLGPELLQFKNADLIGADTYQLTGFLRGRRGTEFTTGTHAVGERFYLLPVVNLPESFSDIGNLREYKGVANGSTLVATVAQPFTEYGAALRCYSPVQAYGGVDGSGNVTMTCGLRTRIGGAWNNFVDIAISEPTVTLIWQIWNIDHTKCARVISTNAPIGTYADALTAAYLIADITSDFGGAQQHYYFSVAQFSTLGLGIQAYGVVPGTGGSDNDPLSPIPPFGVTPPLPPISGCSGSVLPASFTWSSLPQTLQQLPLPAGTTWLLSFTTGATLAPGAGTIICFEDADSPCTKTMILSDQPCGNPLAMAVGLSPSIAYFLRDNPYPYNNPTLAINTTYYVMVTQVQSFGAQCALTKPPGS